MKIFKSIWKKNKVWLFVTSGVLAFLLIASLVLTQNVFLYNTFNTVFGGARNVVKSGDASKYQYYSKDTENFEYFETDLNYDGLNANQAKKATYEAANKLNEKMAEEGIVLLKNDNGALPLKNNAQVSVFGKNSVNIVTGGSGSGGGGSSDAATLYDSLDEAGIKYNKKLKEFYENDSKSGSGRSKNPDMGSTTAGLKTGETPQSSYGSDLKSSYADFKDAAIVVISRIGGEGFDLPRTMKTSYADNAKAVDGATNADDHYLELDKNEKDLLRAVCSAGFEKVVLVINCSTSMELGFLDDVQVDGGDNEKFKIDAALWIGSPGATGIMALGKVLNGEVNPSGRLVDVYARDFKKDPTWQNFGNNNIDNGHRYLQGGTGVDAYFVEYEEDIYYGYRYYETRAYTEATIYGDTDWYKNNVVYPFGYGLSYTAFDWEIVDYAPSDMQLEKDSVISVKVKVTNTGDAPGMDVVQLYYTAPFLGDYMDTPIEKAHVVLGDFEKTPMLYPSSQANGTSKPNSCTVELKINAFDMASYDYNDANSNGFKGYELEDGNYSIRIGKNSHDCWIDESGQYNPLTIEYYVPQTLNANMQIEGFTYASDPVTNYPVTNRFDDVSSHINKYLSRTDWNSTMPSTPTATEREVSGEFINSLKFAVADEGKPYYVTEENMPVFGTTSAEHDYNLYDLIQYNSETGELFVDYNDEKWEYLLNKLTVEQMAYLIGTGNFNTSYIESIDKPKTTDPDGPAGYTNFMGDPTVYGTCYYSSECVIAATWNKKLVHDMGVMVGLESLCGNAKVDGTPYSGWYAPAMNLHRSPFGGRNFEYYSEDPILSGKMGASLIQGAKSMGVYTYVKHFALNDQETDRCTNGLITWANEQTMREIYFKPFEIAVKEGGTTAIMSSFNRLGVTWAGGSYELLTEVLRGEWGFKGMVVSDYNLYDYMPADQMIRAGGDINLTQNKQPSISKAALTATQVTAMRNATKNILYTVTQSNAMNGHGDGVVWGVGLAYWVIVLIVVDVTVPVGLSVWGFFVIRKGLKTSKEQLANSTAHTEE